jgi:hypothetical protein
LTPLIIRFPEDCSEEQLKILGLFKKELANSGINDPRFDEAYLLRFLRARKFDLGKTLLMWNNFIKWRKDFNVDEIDVRLVEFKRVK